HDSCRRLRRSLCARRGWQARPVARRGQSIMSDSTFKVGLIQMRSGLDPQANLAAALALIDEAKRAGADYVLTPEMTNILALKREHLFATIVAEDQDPTLATLREVARKTQTFIHIGSRAFKGSPDNGAHPSL